MMLGRLWHIWQYLSARVFERHMYRDTFAVGHGASILALLKRQPELTHALAMKLYFRRRPMATVFWLFVALLLSAAYALRAAESSVNSFHSVYFWNQLWLVVVTMSTVGYGDNVPATHLGRLIAVVVMIFGTVSRLGFRFRVSFGVRFRTSRF